MPCMPGWLQHNNSTGLPDKIMITLIDTRTSVYWLHELGSGENIVLCDCNTRHHINPHSLLTLLSVTNALLYPWSPPWKCLLHLTLLSNYCPPCISSWIWLYESELWYFISLQLLEWNMTCQSSIIVIFYVIYNVIFDILLFL